MDDQKAITVAECLFQRYVLKHRVMEVVHMDKGRRFKSNVVRHLSERPGMRRPIPLLTIRNQMAWRQV